MRWVRWASVGLPVVAVLAITGVAASQANPLPTPAAPTATATAAAPAAPPTYALAWVRAEGAEECPNGHALATEVQRRLGRNVFDVTAERSIEVEVTRFGAIYRSDVYVRDASGHALGHRSLQSDEPSCGALVNATALAIALVIDPEAGSREPPPRATAAAFEPPPPPAPPPAPPPPPPPPAPTRIEPAPAKPEAQPATPRPAMTMSARGQVGAGVVPALGYGAELAFGMRPFPRWGFSIEASYVAPRTATQGSGSLDLGLTRASALVTFDVAHSRRAHFALGAGPSLGAFHVAVRRPAPITDPGDYWYLAAAFEADFQLAITDGIFVELGGTALVPLRQQQFAVRGQAEAVWSQTFLGGLGFAGVGAVFP